MIDLNIFDWCGGLITGNSHLSNIFILVDVVDDGDGAIVDAGLKLTF